VVGFLFLIGEFRRGRRHVQEMGVRGLGNVFRSVSGVRGIPVILGIIILLM